MADLTGNNRYEFSGAAVATASVATATTLPPLPPGEEIYDLMPTLTMSLPWLSYLFKIFVVVLVIYCLYRLYIWMITEPIRVRPPLVVSPEKAAFRAIERLRLSPVWQQRQMKEICETLTFILKSYLFERYQVGLGPAATSDEFLRSLAEKNPAPELKKRVAELFAACDRVKFMGESSQIAAEDLLESVWQLIKSEGWQP